MDISALTNVINILVPMETFLVISYYSLYVFFSVYEVMNYANEMMCLRPYANEQGSVW